MHCRQICDKDSDEGVLFQWKVIVIVNSNRRLSMLSELMWHLHAIYTCLHKSLYRQKGRQMYSCRFQPVMNPHEMQLASRHYRRRIVLGDIATSTFAHNADEFVSDVASCCSVSSSSSRCFNHVCTESTNLGNSSYP
jgi:hypothetical protein